MNTVISVVIPTYNRPLLVRQAVESILSQEGDFSFEVIVIDDGSTLHARDSLAPYMDRIRYVWQENAGLNASRNRGVRMATGEYIALLDDDDCWLPFKTALQLAALREFPGAAFVHSNFFIWNPRNSTRRADGIRSWFPRPFGWEEMYGDSAEIVVADGERHGLAPGIRIYCGDTYYWALFAPMVLPSAAIIRRDVFDQGASFPEDDPSCGDWEFFARLSKRRPGVFLPVETTLNRSHEDTWRLTRIDETLQIGRRVAMIRRLWRRDSAFLACCSATVDQVEGECLRRLARYQMLKGDRQAALRSCAELASLQQAVHRPADGALRAFLRLPYSCEAAIGMKWLVNALRRQRGTGSSYR